jgi:hypothetical protein
MTKKKITNHALVATTYLFLQAIAIGFSSWSFKIFGDKNNRPLKVKLLEIINGIKSVGISEPCDEFAGSKSKYFTNLKENIKKGIINHFDDPGLAINNIIDSAKTEKPLGNPKDSNLNSSNKCNIDILKFRNEIKGALKGPIREETLKAQKTKVIHVGNKILRHTEGESIMEAGVCAFGFAIGVLIIFHVIITTAILYTVNTDNIPKYRKVIQGIAWANVSLLCLMVGITPFLNFPLWVRSLPFFFLQIGVILYLFTIDQKLQDIDKGYHDKPDWG